jgi:undecaprenyl-diphosphatase
VAGFWEAILLAVLQGLTEFLPVSSSAHLALARALLGFRPPGVTLEVALHAGTLVALVLYFRRDVAWLLDGLRALAGRRGGEREALRWVGWILVGSVPAGIAGLLWADRVEVAFRDPVLVAALLVLTGLVLLSTRFLPAASRRLSGRIAILVGLAQAASLLPGISRSGWTIAAGLALGLRAEEAARFSFLLAIPAVAGAVLFSIKDLGGAVASGWGLSLAAGFVVAAGVGYAAIAFLLGLLRRGRFADFGFYCLAVGVAALLYFALS